MEICIAQTEVWRILHVDFQPYHLQREKCFIEGSRQPCTVLWLAVTADTYSVRYFVHRWNSNYYLMVLTQEFFTRRCSKILIKEYKLFSTKIFNKSMVRNSK
jgi:hypothetical protein